MPTATHIVRRALGVPVALGLLLSAPGAAGGQPLKIPHQQFRLDNGLNVILHHDPRLPRVAVNVLYRIGSRDDPARRAGVAHLFEHLMFMGTTRLPQGKLDTLMEQAGGWNNAYTTFDQTVYYDVGPSGLLALLLWAEADRMSSLADAVTPEKLQLQRDVVINELKQSYKNAPYGEAHLLIPSLVFPAGHPYARPIIGSEEDVRRVTVPDVRRLFRKYYAPSNASLVVAGRFDPAKARGLVEQFFGWIPAGPRVRRSVAQPFEIEGPVRQVLHDRVKLSRVYLIWSSPALMAPGDAELDLAADILTDGKQSRLERVLVHEKKLALEVDAHQESRRLGSQFVVELTAREGVEPAELVRAADEVLQGLRDAPAEQRELDRAVSGFESHFVSRLQKLERRSELLNVYWAATGHPDYVEQDLARYRKVTVDSVHRWFRDVLQPTARVELTVLPKEGDEATPQ